ncbi:cyclic pyranopterin phosphate synthase [Lewinella marina]|uniref:cyclic pyranopterin monophosphate synthase n=1 Tax=Neolewinella marina TaxID=438751 RepID=A0A2G0CIN7_9BACT|nr:cyclic pyranopterin monophosphate synthase MoaC [Neolewinella marina]NJB85034.1 cyclic pyranopterin phosphate synthase [Neolewinella marina]PHK99818.1 cyclic pyranopterin monophosphate synthase MoaC [Neolewinella marina]
MPLSHLDDAGRPAMVDVGDKAITQRTATAGCRVVLGKEILDELRRGDFNTKKGSVIQTAVIAATMAVKQTSAVIPLCHPLPINGCKVAIEEAGEDTLEVSCTVKTEGKTGVEMEALHGASVAALTIYDMCKAMSHDIEIQDLRLESKRGGKSDYDRG